MSLKNYIYVYELVAKGFVTEILHTGSRVICDPAPTDTDDDYLVLLSSSKYKPLKKFLLDDGFCIGGSGVDDSEFLSLKKNDLNIIATHDMDFFTNSVKATKLAKALNLLKKEDRITLFRAIRDNVWPE